MLIEHILHTKGVEVATVTPDARRSAMPWPCCATATSVPWS